MVTQPDHDALVERVRALEARLDAGLPADLAGMLSALRGVCAGNECAELAVFGGRVIDRLDARLRPLATALERADAATRYTAPNGSPEDSRC